MAKLNRLLIALLVAQIAIFALVKLWPASQHAVKPHQVFSFKSGDVEQLEIKERSFEGKLEQVTLARRAGRWVLASGGDHPLLGGKVDELLGKLVALQAGAPVSTRAAHQRQLEVAKDHFQRDVTLTLAGAKKVHFLLGSSPGLKKVHLRFADQEAVYAAEPLAAWDVGATPSSWVDTTYFKVDRDQIDSFVLQNKHGKIAVKREGKRWVPLAGSGELEQTEVDSLVSTLSLITLRAPVGKEVVARYGLAAPQAVLVVHTRQAKAPAASLPASTPTSQASQPSSQPALQPHRLRIGAKQDTAYYALRDGSAYVVTVDSSTADALVDKKPADLAAKPKKPEGDKTAPLAPAHP